jgi:hypothetical protein
MGEKGSEGCTTKLKRSLLPNVYAKGKKGHKEELFWFFQKRPTRQLFKHKGKKRGLKGHKVRR